jgi:hypothetical protein
MEKIGKLNQVIRQISLPAFEAKEIEEKLKDLHELKTTFAKLEIRIKFMREERKELERRRTQRKLELQEFQKRLKQAQERLRYQSAPVTGQPAIQEIHLSLSRYRRILIKDLVSIFKLRKVVRKAKTGSTVEYRILSVGCPLLSSLSQAMPSLAVKKINSFAIYVVQMTCLIASYLGLTLPYSFLYNQGIPSVCLEPALEEGNRPLALTPTNGESFLVGMAVLNYNLAFLCFSQGVEISLEKTTATLDLLAGLCESPQLGRLETTTFLILSLVTPPCT